MLEGTNFHNVKADGKVEITEKTRKAFNARRSIIVENNKEKRYLIFHGKMVSLKVKLEADFLAKELNGKKGFAYRIETVAIENRNRMLDEIFGISQNIVPKKARLSRIKDGEDENLTKVVEGTKREIESPAKEEAQLSEVKSNRVPMPAVKKSRKGTRKKTLHGIKEGQRQGTGVAVSGGKNEELEKFNISLYEKDNDDLYELIFQSIKSIPEGPSLSAISELIFEISELVANNSGKKNAETVLQKAMLKFIDAGF